MFIRVRPTANLYLLGSSQIGRTLVVIHGTQMHAYSPMSRGDLLALKRLATSGDANTMTPAIKWLVDIGIAELGQAPLHRSGAWTGEASRQIASYSLHAGIEAAPLIDARIRKSRALIVGVGGIGCNVAQQLLLMGVKKFVLLDPDRVEASNLNRQVLFSRSDIGLKKVDAAAAYMRSRASPTSLDIQIIDEDFLDWHPTRSELSDISLAIISADGDPSGIRKKASRDFFSARVPHAFAAYSGTTGIVGPLIWRFDSGCGLCKHHVIDASATLTPVRGPALLNIPPSSTTTNSILSSLLVDSWVKSIVNSPDYPSRISFDTLKLRTRRERMRRVLGCPVCDVTPNRQLKDNTST